MLKLTNFGRSSEILKEEPKRYIDEDNDIYPPPMMNTEPSRVVKGFDKLIFAIMYLKSNRVRQLILSEDKDFNIFDTNYYRQNIISMTTSRNYPTNIFYTSNKEKYEYQFFVVLKSLKSEQLVQLFANLRTDMNWHGKYQIEEIFENLGDRPHMLIALWNNGLNYSKENVSNYAYTPLKHILIKYIDSPYVPSKRYHLLLIDYKCPITMSSITRPAILSDGSVYEYLSNIKIFERPKIEHNGQSRMDYSVIWACSSNALCLAISPSMRLIKAINRGDFCNDINSGACNISKRQ